MVRLSPPRTNSFAPSLTKPIFPAPAASLPLASPQKSQAIKANRAALSGSHLGRRQSFSRRSLYEKFPESAKSQNAPSAHSELKPSRSLRKFHRKNSKTF